MIDVPLSLSFADDLEKLKIKGECLQVYINERRSQRSCSVVVITGDSDFQFIISDHLDLLLRVPIRRLVVMTLNKVTSPNPGSNPGRTFVLPSFIWIISHLK